MKYLLFLFTLSLLFPTFAFSEDKEVRADKKKFEAKGFWLYNDLDEAYKVAKEKNKPILAVFRCIPCKDCVKIDDVLIETHPMISLLLKSFVCVRVVNTNGLDLNLFQFDTDMSFVIFFLNADKTIYGRYGTRSHRTEWEHDVSLEGLSDAMLGALDLHKGFPKNKRSLAGKKGNPIEYRTPERYSYIKRKPSKLDYSKPNVAKDCIHCHEIGEARREYYWRRSKPVPDKLMIPYPHPKSIGLILDPKKKATIKSLKPKSPADKAGLKNGDEILAMNGQPLLSFADIQWVLHQQKESSGELRLEILRNKKKLNKKIRLKSGWKLEDERSWRTSAWTNRRIALGGMKLDPLTDQERKRLGIRTPLALKPHYIGNWGPYGTANKIGVRKGDVIIEFDGQKSFKTEGDILDYVNKRKRVGDSVKLVVLRNGKKISFRLPIQK